MKDKKKRQIVQRQEPGRCADCGCLTHSYDTKYQWYICKDHKSERVAEAIAHHVMHPDE